MVLTVLCGAPQGYSNEQDVGKALVGRDRSSFFVVTKLTGDNHGAAGVHRSIAESLQKLGVDFVDLFLIHNPSGGDCIETWKAMLEVKAKGQARAVGVSNFGVAHLKALENAGLEMPEVNQVELHCWLQQKLLVSYHASKQIATMGYCPMARAKKFGEDNTIARLAEKYSKTEAQIMIRWSLQMGYITIPKSVNEPRIVANSDIFDFQISVNDMTAIAELDEDFHASNASGSQHLPVADIV